MIPLRYTKFNRLLTFHLQSVSFPCRKMVFSDDDKAVIKNYYVEKCWSVCRICNEHPTKKWYKGSVQRLINQFKENGTMKRRPGSGRPRSAITPENEETVAQLICSQEESPETHISPREIERHTGIKRSSIVRMVRKNGWKQYKQIKTSRMSEGPKKRQTERVGALGERFSNKRSVEKCVWQDEKDFMLEVPLNHQNSRVYRKNRKGDISEDRLFHNTNRQSKKVIVSACIKWYGATKPFFVNNKSLKVNAKRYKNHLEKELLPNIESMMKRKDWIFIQDRAPSHRAYLVQDFLWEKLNKRFVKYSEWLPTSPDCNPLDYYF